MIDKTHAVEFLEQFARRVDSGEMKLEKFYLCYTVSDEDAHRDIAQGFNSREELVGYLEVCKLCQWASE